MRQVWYSLGFVACMHASQNKGISGKEGISVQCCTRGGGQKSDASAWLFSASLMGRGAEGREREGEEHNLTEFLLAKLRGKPVFEQNV